MRLHHGAIAFLDHLYEGVMALDTEIFVTPEALTQRLFSQLKANDKSDGMLSRLMMSRGMEIKLSGVIQVVAEQAQPYYDMFLSKGCMFSRH